MYIDNICSLFKSNETAPLLKSKLQTGQKKNERTNGSNVGVNQINQGTIIETD